ncbi:hypothetical protein QBC44DRAFT_229006 [Cladorrhinum sp. PSN332]|nr:hypothetical protein QBC44DRAFT_229006 [Cladorrhinum sp. PSN332]
MFATRVLRQAAAHAERVPSIRFVGKRTIPSQIDHSRQPHPQSPTHALPASFTNGSSHTSFSAYRDHAQQFGPLRKTITPEAGIGGAAGSQLGSVAPPAGVFFDRNDLPTRFHRTSLSPDEIEAIESGGAAAFA